MSAPSTSISFTDPSVRRTFLGASDAPIILGSSPYKTPLQLWQEKTGRVEPPPTNWAQARGHEREIEAREAYELASACIANPAEFVHPEHDWLRVHPDGVHQGLDQSGTPVTVLVECKWVGREEFAQLKQRDVVPQKHVAQVQCQLLVAAAAIGQPAVLDYVLYNGDDIFVIRVHPDDPYQRFLLIRLEQFWELVQSDTAPEFDPEHDVDQRDDAEWWAVAQQYKVAYKNKQAIEADLGRLHAALAKLAIHHKTSGNGVTFTRFERKGNVDYPSVPELSGIPNLKTYLDGFRLPAMPVEKVTVAE